MRYSVLDVILEGGSVIDGAGTPRFSTDIAIADGLIARIGDCSGLDATSRVACAGLVIAPGFIDMHGHSDELLLVAPLAPSKTRQGITTEIGGNCGASPGPLSDEEFESRGRRLFEQYGLRIEWRDMGGFLDALEPSPPALNFACLVGLGETRAAVGGAADAPLGKDELAREAALVRASCEAGAIGVSSGLIYPPGSFADIDELVAMAAAARDSGCPLYASHIRDEGDALIDATAEALEVGRRAETAVQLSHHKAAGQRNWGKVHDTLAMVDRARGSGLDVVLDQYPYKASSTGLDVILPRDVNVGGREAVAQRLADPVYAAFVAARVQSEYADRWDHILISAVASERHRRFEGKTVAQIAAETGQPPVQAALGLLRDDRLDVAAIYFTMCEDDVRTVLSYGNTCIGTDASARSLEGPTSRGVPHPRAFGTFPRLFARYVRQTKVLTLEEAVRRCTSLPAQRLGLRRRGTVAVGWHADLVVFDPSAICDTATYENPKRFPEGVAHVFVNGVPVVRGGEVTGLRPGRVLRRGRDL